MLDFAFGSYTILPDPGAGDCHRVAGSDAGAGAGTEPSSRSASANLERFFDEADDPLHDDAVLTPEAVNSAAAEGVARQSATCSLAPDILGVVEVENLGILQRLAARINADAVAETGVRSDLHGLSRRRQRHRRDRFRVPGEVVARGRAQRRADSARTRRIRRPDRRRRAAALLNDRPPLVLKAAVHGPRRRRFRSR